jgi:hypothetical protein
MSNMFLNIVSTFKGDGIKKATGELGAFSGKMGGLGSVLGKVGGALAAFGATAKAISFGQEAITQARDLERNMYGLQKVFGLMAPVMTDFVENASSIGLSQSEAAKASTFLGSVLKQSGFAMTDVATETEKLVKLGVDLATLYGYDVQEALLGMTALFRGEYDPIEKFGVAMKQSEINTELAARSQDNLAGAARRNAEQTIRLEFLYERAADALGSFDEQTNNLFVSQKVLGATFRDMQAAVGTALIPAITTLNQELTSLVTNSTPTLISMFERLAGVLTEVVSLFSDALNPATALGDSVFALGVRFESLLQTIFGKDFNIGIIFDIAGEAIRIFLTLLHDVILMIQNIITFFQLLGEQIGAFFNALATGNWEDYFNTDWAARFKNAMDDNANAIYNASGAMDTYSGKLRKSAIEAKLLAGELLTVGEAMLLASPDAASSKARRAQLREENRRARAGLGLSAISTDTGSGGTSAAEKAAKEAEKIAKELADAQEKAARELQDALDEAARKEEERIRRREDAYKSFADSVKSTFGSIKDSILSAFSLPDLGNSVNSITRNIQKLLGRTREFAKNITTLSEQGLSNDLLQQVIGAGPVEGAKLAQALVGGGQGFIGQINQAFSEFGGLAGSIAGVGTRGAFAGQQTINNYSIEVTGGLATGSDVGRAVVNAIRDYERQSGAAWRA